MANALATAGNAEAYFEFADDYGGGRPAMPLVRAGENVIVFRSSATAHGLAALPFGYAIAPRALARVPQFKKPLRSMADTYAI